MVRGLRSGQEQWWAGRYRVMEKPMAIGDGRNLY